MNEDGRVFVDRKHPVARHYEKYMGRERSDLEKLKVRMREFIARDADFLSPYLLLAQVLYSEGDAVGAEEVLDRAYEKALDTITDQRGRWPDVLRGDHPHNGHIVETILTRAIWHWEDERPVEALEILRRLYRADPEDGIAARYYILAIRTGMGYEEFEERFGRGDYYSADLKRWFRRNSERFPGEFRMPDGDSSGPFNLFRG